MEWPSRTWMIVGGVVVLAGLAFMFILIPAIMAALTMTDVF